MDQHPKIAVAITTKDRPQMFYQSLSEWLRHSPEWIDFFIVDDGSQVPVESILTFDRKHSLTIHRHDTPKGIAAAKNKCFELCEDYDHIFLSDDDFYPTTYGWWEPYVNSGENHLMYIFQHFKRRKLHDTVEIYRDDRIVAYNHARGCLLYYTKKCLQVAGGMREEFGKWGYEHPDLSNRIYNLGLSTFQYADVVGSDRLFYSADEHEAVVTTCSSTERYAQIMKNEPLYVKLRHNTDYVPYKPGATRIDEAHKGQADIILTCYFTGLPDPQGRVFPKNVAALEPLRDSRSRHGIDELVVLTDTWPIEGLADDWGNPVTWLKDECKINPYFQRWVSYRRFLMRNRRGIDKVWCVDATDVEILKDPFPHMIPGVLYTGDEPSIIGHNEWLRNHHRNNLLQTFFRRNARETVLNAGLLGGDVDTVIRFCGLMISTYGEMLADETRGFHGPGFTDMGVFNYVARTHFTPEFGRHVNTPFKAYQYNGYSWFKHK